MWSIVCGFAFIASFIESIEAQPQQHQPPMNKQYCRFTVVPQMGQICNGFNNTLPTFWDSSMVWTLDMGEGGNTLDRLREGELLRIRLWNLRTLILARCQIKEIEMGAFNGSHSIAELDLSKNLLKKLNPGVFSDLPNLQVLLLNDNPLGSFDEGVKFPKSNFMRILSLAGCQLEGIKKGLFENLVSLKELILDRNPLPTESNWIPPLTNLEFLSLRGCQIKSLKEGFFDNLSSLKALYLDDNQLNNVDWIGNSKTLKNLTVLGLNNNSFEALDPSLFKDLDNLRELRLNNVTFKKNAKFPRLKNLRKLTLSGSKLESLKSSRLFKNLTNLQELDLSNNNLARLEWKVIQPLKKLKNIQLLNNPLKCDCQLRFTFDLLSKRKILLDGIWSVTHYENKCGTPPTCAPTVTSLQAKITLENADMNEGNGKASSRDEGASATFYCEVSGNPKSEVKWMKDGKPLEESWRTTIIDTEVKAKEEGEMELPGQQQFRPHFILTNLKSGDEGKYECIVSNDAGSSNKSFVLSLENFRKEKRKKTTKTAENEKSKSSSKKTAPEEPINKKAVQEEPISKKAAQEESIDKNKTPQDKPAEEKVQEEPAGNTEDDDYGGYE